MLIGGLFVGVCVYIWCFGWCWGGVACFRFLLVVLYWLRWFVILLACFLSVVFGCCDCGVVLRLLLWLFWC